MKILGTLVTIGAIGLLGAGACKPHDPSAWVDAALSQAAGDPTALQDALYASGCASCHGQSGGGDGPMIVELGVTPTAFTSTAWQQKTSDEQIDKATLHGGEAVGLSRFMPAFLYLQDRPEVVDALRERIRRFGQPAPD